MTAIPPYPLCWPDGMTRTPPEKRAASQFKTTLAGAIKNVSDSLRRFGVDSGRTTTNVVATSNYGGLSLSQSAAPRDPGVAVWFDWDGEQRCIAVDRYGKPEENLQAIHHIIEARRTEVRHGGLECQDLSARVIRVPAWAVAEYERTALRADPESPT